MDGLFMVLAKYSSRLNGGRLPSLDLGQSSRPCYVSDAIFSPPNKGHTQSKSGGDV